jgi:DNA polymerase-3 subunit beta
MEFSILQENLKQGLTTTSHIAGKNINLPVLSNIMLKAKDGNIKLISTNLEIGIVSSIRGKVEKEGSCLVDAKTINEYINLLPNKKINIKQKEQTLIIESENYKTKINTINIEEFPLIPVVDKKNYYKTKINDFKKALVNVVFSASTSESRMELTGILFNFENEKLIMAATDSYRLAEKEIEIKSENKTDSSRNIILPSKTIQELIRILGSLNPDDSAGEITFYLSENQILFVINNIEIVSRLIEGQYPDYKQIIPLNIRTKILINRMEFIRAIKVSALFSKTGINDVDLDFPNGKNKVIISSTSGQTGENITEIETAVSGEDNAITLNYRYLLDGLNNIEEENVRLEVIDNNTPCILRPEGKDIRYLYIIMPIKQ